MPNFLPHYEHIPVHRLWAYATLQVELSMPEHAHIIDCDDCVEALRVCLRSENFASVLRELDWHEKPDTRESA